MVIIYNIIIIIIIIIIGALGVIKKGTEQYLCEIPGNNNLQEIQKNSTSGNSAHSEKGSLNQVNRTNTPLVSWFGSQL